MSNSCLSAPGLSWVAMFKMTKIELKLTSDPNMYLTFEKGREMEFLIFLTDTAKSTINIKNLMTQNKNENILYT